MAHFADGRWHPISGLVAQVQERSRTHVNSATNTELSYTVPLIEKTNAPLSDQDMLHRSYRASFHIATSTTGGTGNGFYVQVGYSDAYSNASQTYNSNSSQTGDRATNSGVCALDSATGSTSGVVDIWVLPGSTIVVKTKAYGTNASHGVADVNITLEAL